MSLPKAVKVLPLSLAMPTFLTARMMLTTLTRVRLRRMKSWRKVMRRRKMTGMNTLASPRASDDHPLCEIDQQHRTRTKISVFCTRNLIYHFLSIFI